MVLGNLFGKKGDTDPPEEEEKLGTFARLRRGLGKTRDALASVFSLGRKLDDDLLEEVETILIQADFGPTLALDLCDDLRESYSDREFSPEEAIPFLKGKLREKLGEGHGIVVGPHPPSRCSALRGETERWVDGLRSGEDEPPRP